MRVITLIPSLKRLYNLQKYVGSGELRRSVVLLAKSEKLSLLATKCRCFSNCVLNFNIKRLAVAFAVSGASPTGKRGRGGNDLSPLKV